MDTNSVISLMNVMTSEAPQYQAGAIIDDDYSSGFSQTLEMAQVQTQQTSPANESLPVSEQEKYEEPVKEIRNESNQPISDASNISSDNNKPKNADNNHNKQNRTHLESNKRCKTQENSQYPSGKKLAEGQTVIKGFQFSDDIVSKHTQTTQQSAPLEIETDPQSGININNSENQIQTASLKAIPVVQNNIQGNNDEIDFLMQTDPIENSVPKMVKVSDNLQDTKVISSRGQTGQNQAQAVAVDKADVKIIAAETTEQIAKAENIESYAKPYSSKMNLSKEETQQYSNQRLKTVVNAQTTKTGKENQQNVVEEKTVQVDDKQPLSQNQHILSTKDSQNIRPAAPKTSTRYEMPAEQKPTDVISDLQLNTKQATDNKFSADYLMNKPITAQMQVTKIQTSSSTVQKIDLNIDPETQQLININGGQNPNFETSDLPQQNQNNDMGILLNTASASVGRQIQESIQSSFADKQRQITVNLQPPELGRVTIKFEQQGDDITGQLEVTKAETRSAITEQLPEIIKNLTDAGIQIKKIEVNMSTHYGSDNYKDQQPQDMFFGDQDNLNQQYDAQQMSETYEIPQDSIEAGQPFETDFYDQQMAVGQPGSLNMLV